MRSDWFFFLARGLQAARPFGYLCRVADGTRTIKWEETT